MAVSDHYMKWIKVAYGMYGMALAYSLTLLTGRLPNIEHVIIALAVSIFLWYYAENPEVLKSD